MVEILRPSQQAVGCVSGKIKTSAEGGAEFPNATFSTTFRHQTMLFPRGCSARCVWETKAKTQYDEPASWLFRLHFYTYHLPILSIRHLSFVAHQTATAPHPFCLNTL